MWRDKIVKLLGKGDVVLDLVQGCILLFILDISLRLQLSFVYLEGYDVILRLGLGIVLEFNGKIDSWRQNKVDQVQRVKDEMFF